MLGAVTFNSIDQLSLFFVAIEAKMCCNMPSSECTQLVLLHVDLCMVLRRNGFCRFDTQKSSKNFLKAFDDQKRILGFQTSYMGVQNMHLLDLFVDVIQNIKRIASLHTLQDEAAHERSERLHEGTSIISCPAMEEKIGPNYV